MNTRLNRIIAIWEMVGGLIGIIVSIIYMFAHSAKPIELPFYALFIVVYLLSGVAGFYLWKNHRRGISLSILIQVLQLPYFSFSGLITYLLTLPLSIVVMLYGGSTGSGTDVGFHLQLFVLPEWSLRIGGVEGQFALGVNVVALICLGYLVSRLSKRPVSVPSADSSVKEAADAQGLDSESSVSEIAREGTGD
jgi:hypothetical protein